MYVQPTMELVVKLKYLLGWKIHENNKPTALAFEDISSLPSR